MSNNHKTKHSQISKSQIHHVDAMPISFIKESLLDLIKEQHPGIDENGYISLKELKKFKAQLTENKLKQEKVKLTDSEREIVDSIESSEVLSRSPEELEYAGVSYGEKMADKVARFVGSWSFVIFFTIMCLTWMMVNLFALKGFDPYPFILLNLVLSCIAALQAPLIMMSQNRQEKKDRKRSENDYKINLKAELEIQQLHEKVDMLLIKLSEKEEAKSAN